MRRREPWGVWGGELFANGKVLAQKRNRGRPPKVAPAQFLSPHGIRSVSIEHRDNPYRLTLGDQSWELKYTPGESDTGSFGGNSNWRGPVWFPMNFLLIESLFRFHAYYGDDFTVECPTGSGQYMTLREVAEFLCDRLSGVFLPGPDGVRPAHLRRPRLDKDPLFAGNPLFHEYFHGDDGHGLRRGKRAGARCGAHEEGG
mgnify:CR=1 FL=1